MKRRIEIIDGKLRAAFVLSRAIAGTNIGKDIARVLEGYELPILTRRIHQRVDYPGTAATGSTVLEMYPKSEASKEVLELIAEVEQFTTAGISIRINE